MHHHTVRRVSRAATTLALIGALTCSPGVPEAAAAADPIAPAWLVTAQADRPTKIVEGIVEGIVVRPEPASNVLPTHDYRLTATFGKAGGLWSRDHTGLDFAAPSGTPLFAIGDGVVTEVGYDGAYGNKTVIALEDGTELWYCHQASQSVAVGQSVSAGDVIGAIGTSGNSTGPHLHLEVRRDGEPVDPAEALAEWGLSV